MRFLIVGIILVASVAHASSPSERAELCLNNSAASPAPSAQVTEAKGDCIECLSKVAPKPIGIVSESAKEIKERLQKRRDFEFFKMIADGGLSKPKPTIADLKTALKKSTDALDYYPTIGIDNDAEEGTFLNEAIVAFNKYSSTKPEERASSNAEKSLKQFKSTLMKMLEEKIRTTSEQAKKEPEQKTGYLNYSEHYEKIKSELSDFYQGLESNELTTSRIAAVSSKISYSSFIRYSSKELKDKIALSEKQLAAAEQELKATEGKSKALYSEEGLSDSEKSTLDKYEISYKGKGETGLCGLTVAESYALYYYTGSSYGPLNRSLRSETPSGEALLYKEVLNSGLAKLKSFDGYVKRGTEMSIEQVEKHVVGDTITYNAFTSTSKNNGFNGTQRYVIKSKSGKYIAPISALEGEAEVLFPAGTKFKILEKKQKSEILPSDEEAVVKYKKMNVEFTLEEVE